MKKSILFLLLFCTISGLSVSAPFIGSGDNGILHNTFEEGTKIKMILNGKTYELQSYTLNYVPFDPDKPKRENQLYNFQTNAITINLRTSKIDQELVDWIFSENQSLKDGQIVVYDAESGKPIKTISFKGAKTGSYTENSNMAANYPMTQYQTATFQLKYKTVSVKY